MKPIWISIIAGNIPLPVNMDILWAPVSNKSKLQMFLRKGVIENADAQKKLKQCSFVSVLISMSITSSGLPCVIIRFGLNYRRGRCAVSTTCYSYKTDWSKEMCYSIE